MGKNNCRRPNQSKSKRPKGRGNKSNPSRYKNTAPERKLQKGPKRKGGRFKAKSREQMWGDLPKRPEKGSRKDKLNWELEVFKRAREKLATDTFPRTPKRWDHEERVLYSGLDDGDKINKEHIRRQISARRGALRRLGKE